MARLNPFPGLRPFEPDEDHLFFGRAKEIDELLRRLRTTRFLSVVGGSGSGKSSLVRSGLIPSLYSGFMAVAGSSWRVAVMRPGADPIGRLAAALDSPAVLGPPDGLAEVHRIMLETTLRRGVSGLSDCVREARLPRRDNVLVVVDQFEELFRFKHSRASRGSRDDAVAFVELLIEAARQMEIPIYVALTMRSDFIGDCMEIPGLPEAINNGQYLVPRMTRDELRQAIVGPVRVGGGEIAPRLVVRLLNEVGDEQDQLPVLQHALMRSWEHWEANSPGSAPMDINDYQAIGTMSVALSRHADEAYDEIEEAGLGTAAERVFRALTDTSSDSRGVRRPASIEELSQITGTSAEDVVSVVEGFRRPGRSFVTPSTSTKLEADSIVDLSHESLMRGWRRLRSWAEKEADSARTYRRAAEAAERHEQVGAGLWRDPELALALGWRDENLPTAAWAERYEPGFDRAMGFLDASRTDRDRRQAERRRLRRLALYRVGALAALLGLVAVGMGLLWREAVRQRLEAREQQYLSDVLLARTRIEQGLHEQAAAILWETPVDPRHWEWGYLLSRSHPDLLTLREPEGEVDSASFSPDGQRIVTATNCFVAGVWDARSGQRLRSLEACKPTGDTCPEAPLNDRLVASARFSLDSSRIVTTCQNGLSRVWEPKEGKVLAEKRLLGADDCDQSRACLGSVSIGPDGGSVLTLLPARGVARLWEPDETGEPRDFEHATAAAISPGLETFAIASENGVLSLRQLANGALLARGESHDQRMVRALAFSASGDRLVTAGEDSTARVWDVQASGTDWVPAATLIGHRRPVRWAEFSSDGNLVVTASADYTARIWDAISGQELRQFSHRTGEEFGPRDQVDTASFSPDGRLVLTTASERARVWPLETPDEDPWALDGEVGRAIQARFGPDGFRIVTANPVAKIWASETVAQSRSHCCTLAVLALEWSAEGLRAVSLSDDGTQVVVLDAATGDSVRTAGIDHEEVIWAGFTADQGRLVTASWGSVIKIWEEASSDPDLWTEIDTFPTHELDGLQGAALSPDGRKVATASSDQTARIWDLSSGEELATLSGHGDEVLAVAFSAAGDKLLTASEDKTARMWDVDSGEQILVLVGHEGAVRSAEFSPDGERIVTASDDSTVRVWHAEKGRELASLPQTEGYLSRASFDPSGMTLATVLDDQVVSLEVAPFTPPESLDWRERFDEWRRERYVGWLESLNPSRTAP